MNALATTQSLAPPRTSVWSTLQTFPQPVWILFLGMFINRFGTFVIPFLALHVTRLGYSARAAGLAVSAYGAGHLLASLLGGHWADNLGRRATIVGSLLAGAASMLALSQAHAFALIILVAFVTGLAGEAYRPASSALLTDIVPSGRQVVAFAGYRFAINAGWAFGPAVGGLLAQHSYFWLFAGDAATSTLFAAIALAFLPRDAPARGSRSAGLADPLGSFRKTARSALSNRPFGRLMLATFAVALVFLQMISTLGLQIRAAGYSDATYGWVLALNGALIVLLEIPLSGVTQRLAPRRVIAAGFLLIGLGSSVYGWARAPWEFALGMAVFTLGETVSMPVALAYAARLAPEALRGRYLGLYGLTWASALTFGPSVGLALFAVSPSVLWTACGLLGLAAAAIMRPQVPE